MIEPDAGFDAEIDAEVEAEDDVPRPMPRSEADAEILPQNDRMVALARKASNQVSVHREEDSLHMTMLF